MKSIFGFCQDSSGGGILLHIRENISFNLIAIENKPIESFFVELNLHIDEWLINCSYNLYKSFIGNHLNALTKKLDLYSLTYEKVIILGDFNVDIEEKHKKCFCDSYNLKSLIKHSTCYKNPDSPTGTDP